MVDVPKLLSDLSAQVFRMGPRLRLAVTADEMHAIDLHCLMTTGQSFRRVRNVPLIVEDDPTKPPLEVIHAIVGSGVLPSEASSCPIEEWSTATRRSHEFLRPWFDMWPQPSMTYGRSPAQDALGDCIEMQRQTMARML